SSRQYRHLFPPSFPTRRSSDLSIVPSRLAEHARWSLGVAGELERSLRAVDGVLTARVHLAVPPRDSLAPEAAPERPSAAVLVRQDRKSTRLNSSHVKISYAVFC